MTETTLDIVLREMDLADVGWKRMPLIAKHFTRGDLARLFKTLGFTKGAEIGVQQGRFSLTLLHANENLKLFCIDPWCSYEIPGMADYPVHRIERAYRDARKRLSGLNCELIRKTSDEAVSLFEDESLDFVFIDGDHDFQHVTNDIFNYSKKVRKGGIVSGHDYHVRRRWRGTHVVAAVRGITTVLQIVPWFVFDSSEPPSWMWVKE